jgi:hypothetical protein
VVFVILVMSALDGLCVIFDWAAEYIHGTSGLLHWASSWVEMEKQHTRRVNAQSNLLVCKPSPGSCEPHVFFGFRSLKQNVVLMTSEDPAYSSVSSSSLSVAFKIILSETAANSSAGGACTPAQRSFATAALYDRRSD